MRWFGLIAVASLLIGRADGAEPGTARALPPATAYRLTLERFVEDRVDLVVTIFVREGRPSHAWAMAPAADQALHRIDLTPAAPIEYLLDGKRFVPDRKLKGDYDYKNADFLRYREMHAAGKLVMRNYDAPPPLSIDNAAASGVFDVFLDVPDRQKRDRFRVAVNLKRQGDALAGRYEAFAYDRFDETFSPDGEKFARSARLVELTDHWEHRPERALDPRSTWPQQHGPTLTGSAIDCERDLVDNLADARLVWIADMPIPGGRGGIPRSPFGFFPINNSGLGITQYSAPVVANGKVYLALPLVDEEALDKNPGVTTNPRVIRGMDPRALAADLGLFQDALICIDAQTGRTLWIYRDARRSGLVGDSKSGRGLTAVYHDGKVIFRGQHSLYCVDAENGKLVWQNDGQKPTKDGNPGYSFAQAQPWSTDHSPVLIDGVLVVRINDNPKPPKGAPATAVDHTTLVGIDPTDGKLLWRARNVAGHNAIPMQATIAGKPYVVAAYSGIEGVTGQLDKADPAQVGMLTLIEPRSGKIAWQQPVVGPNPMYPVAWNDIVALNVERQRVQPDAKNKPQLVPALGAFRLTTDGPRPLWKHDDTDYQSGRVTPIAHRGVFILDSRESGFRAIDAETGKLLGKFPHIYTMAQGSHNWTWTIASNGRVFTSGDHLLMFRLQDGRFELMPGSLRVDLASGYVCPIRPAIADGRLFVRTGDGLACYDLRKPQGKHAVDTLQLRTDDLALGMAPGKGGVDLQLRMVNDQPDTLLLRFPTYQETGEPRPYAWGGPNAMRWRSTAALLVREGSNLGGELWVRVNEHREPWTFNLTLDGDAVRGSVERRLPAISKPLDLSGAVDGQRQTLADGRVRFSLRLSQAAPIASDALVDVTLFLEQLPDGTLLGHAAGGRINQASFEFDPASLRIESARIAGRGTVLFHSDRFKHVHPELTTALAGVYELDVVVQPDGRLAGSYRATVGGEYRRKVSVTGKRLVGRDAEVEIAANAGSVGNADEDAD